MESPPVNIAAFAIGDGTIGSEAVWRKLPAVSKSTYSVSYLLSQCIRLQLTVIETYPQLIGYDPAVYEYFREQ